MNKTTKAAVAIGAATVLMLGGAGSLAYWQTSMQTTSTEFTTGYISMINQEDSWTLNGEKLTRDELADKLIVPGDTIVFTQNIRVEGVGSNLYLAADVELGGISAVVYDNPAQPKTAAMQPTYTLAPGSKGNPTTVTATDQDDVYDVSFTNIGDLVLTVTLEWPFGTEGSDGVDTMDALVTLDRTGITLRQVPAPLATEPA